MLIYQRFGKRLMDFIVSLTLILILLPVFIILYLFIRIQLGKPVFFKQARPGLLGKVFWIYKFRTMTNEVDAAGNLLPDAKRLTRLGQFLRRSSLDELPELFNVIKGEMSLVGPRPLLEEYLPLYNTFQAQRHHVKPGITGLTQVRGRNLLNWDEKFLEDVWYVNHIHFWLDIKILFLTLYVVMRRQGIQAEGHVSMPKFTGSKIESYSKQNASHDY